MCIIFKLRQNKAGIDDFGKKVAVEDVVVDVEEELVEDSHIPTEDTPLLISLDSNEATAKTSSKGGRWFWRFGQ